MADIFAAMGIDTKGGTFCFPEQKDVDLSSKMNILTQLHSNFQLPIDDDWLYEQFGVEKPKDYDAQKKAQLETIVSAVSAEVPRPQPGEDDDDDDDKKKTEPQTPVSAKGFRNWWRRFFDWAPMGSGADLDW